MGTEIKEYTRTEAALAELRDKYGSSVYDVTTSQGMKDARTARAEIRGYRVDLEKMRKEIKAPALERCRLIDAEAKRITEELVALEGPIDETIKAEEQRKADEKAAREEAERQRIAGIQSRIAAIHDHAARMVGKPSSVIEHAIGKVEAMEISEDEFAEFAEQAQAAKSETVAKLRESFTAQQEHEAEQARIKAEREELEELRKAEAERQAAEEQRIAAERAEQDRIDRERREREEAEHRAKLEAEAAERAEAERIEREKREAQEAEARKQREAEEQRLREERAALEREKAQRAAAERKAEIDQATLRSAASEAVELLKAEGYGDHIVTLKLIGALERDTADSEQAAA